MRWQLRDRSIFIENGTGEIPVFPNIFHSPVEKTLENTSDPISHFSKFLATLDENALAKKTRRSRV